MNNNLKNVVVYTSITKSYLPKARVLAKSLKIFHPNWKFVLLFSDELPENFNLDKEPFDEILLIEDLQLDSWKVWAFSHTIVELCTAVKGRAAQILASRDDIDVVIYLDPDIKVYNSLSSILELLTNSDILLTPHLLEYENSLDLVKANEINALKYGVYNLGFFAARTTGQGIDFINWWATRLIHFCKDDIPSGLFTDQRWCDLAPAFFDKLCIVRDKGFNCATWNIQHRVISKKADGVYFAGDTPLRFYHFTSYDSGAGLSALLFYAKDQKFAHELWADYKVDLEDNGQGNAEYQDWKYGKFDSGNPIPKSLRLLYSLREDLKKAFPDPYAIKEPSLESWNKNEKNNELNKSEIIEQRQGLNSVFMRINDIVLNSSNERKDILRKIINTYNFYFC
jgi:hypothetical protein